MPCFEYKHHAVPIKIKKTTQIPHSILFQHTEWQSPLGEKLRDLNVLYSQHLNGNHLLIYRAQSIVSGMRMDSTSETE